MILVDNTVLSNYALVGRLQLLRLFCAGEGVTTEAVLVEFQAGVERALFAPTDIFWLRQIRIRGARERFLFERLRSRMGAGESSCLAVAIHRNYDLLTDDMEARRNALREGVRVSGSVGVLVRLIKQEIIRLPEGNEVLKALIIAGYFSPGEELDGLL